MKKWLFLLLVVGVLVGCVQQEDEASSGEQVNSESNEKVVEDTSTDSELEAEVSEENDVSEITVEENDQKEESTELSQETESQDEPKQSQETIQEQRFDQQEIDIEIIKNEIKIGMTEQEIIGLIGEPSKKGIDAMNAEPMWLYNIRTIKGYYFEGPKDFEEYGIVDAIDEEGLINNEVDILLFISWNEGKADFIGANYTNDKGEIKDYRLFEEGTVKES